MKKKILAILLALATMATSMVMPAMAKVVTTVDEVLYETDFENFTALSSDNAAGIKTWGGWTVDEAAGFSGKGGFIATGVNNNERNINILASGTGINDGVVELTAKYYPSAYTNKIRLSRSYNANHDHVFTIPTDVERKWYDLDVVIDMDSDLATVTLSADGEVAYTENKAYTYGFMEFNIYQSKTSGNWTNDNTARIDDLKIAKVTKTEVPDEPAEPPVVEEPEVEIPAGEEKIYFNNFNKATWADNGIYYGITSEDGNLSGHPAPVISTWADEALTTGLSGNGTTVISSKDERDFELAVPAVSTGVYKLTYDFYPSAGTDVLNISYRNNSWQHRTTLMTVSGLERKWYKVEAVVDLDKNTATATVFDGETSVYTNTIGYSNDLLLFEFVRKVSGGTMNANESKASIFDNMLYTQVLYIPEPEEPEVEIPEGEEKIYFNNFNKETWEDNGIYYGITDDSGLKGGHVAPVISTWGTKVLTEGLSGNGITIMMANETRDFELVIPPAATGVYKLTYDFYPSAGTDVINLAGNYTSWAGRTALMSVSGLARKWYKVEVIVDLDNNTATATVFDGETSVYTNTIAYANELYQYEFSRTVSGGTMNANESKASIFDNMLVTKLKANPVITVTNKAGEAADVEAVDYEDVKIAINFGEAMNEATLSEDTVVLKAGNTVVEATRSYENGVYTLIPTASLAPATKYEISTTEGILYVDGAKAKAVSFEFTTMDIPTPEDPASDLPAGETKVYFNDFNKASEKENGIYYGITSEDGNLSGYPAPVISTWGGSLVAGLEGNGYAITMTHDTRDFELALPIISTGVVKLSYDFYPSTGTDVLNLAANRGSWNNRVTLMSISGLARKWYKAEVAVDLDNNTATGTIKDGDTVVYTKTISYTVDLALFEFSRTVSGGTADANVSKASVFDNMLVTKVKAVPVVTINNKADGVETDLEAVTPAIESIAINFGEEMNRDTLSNETVVLKAGDKEVDAVRSYENGVYTIVPAAKLSASTEYVLSISEDALYFDGTRVKEFSMKFKTAASASNIVDAETTVYFNDFNKATGSENGIYYGITCEDGSLSGYKAPVIATWADSSITTGLSGNGTAVIHPNETRDFELAIPALSENTCKLTYDFYPSDGKDEVNLARSYNSWAGRTAFMSVSGLERKWYKVEITVDADKDVATGTIYDGDTVVYTNTIAYTHNLLIFEFSRTVIGGTAGDNKSKAAVFDNMLVEMIYTKTPVVMDSSVNVYAFGEAQTDLKSVSSLTDKVVVDFGQPIKAAYLNDEYIYIEKISDSTKVPYTALFENNQYIMILDELMDSNTDYRLVVKEVENLSGLKMEEEYTKNFTVGKEILKATLSKLTQKTNPVENLAGLKKGEKAMVEVDYRSSTGEATDLYLVVSYYKGNKLLKAEYLKKTVGEDITAQTCNFEYQIPTEAELSGYDEVKVMMWNGFSAMMPLSQSISIK